MITSSNPLFITDLIASYTDLFYSLTLTDPCLLPKRQLASTDSSMRNLLMHGGGLFGVNYDHLDHYVYVMSENTLLASDCPPAIGCLPNKDCILFVRDVCFGCWIL